MKASFLDNLRRIFSEYLLSKFVGDAIWLLAAQSVLALSGIMLNIIIGNYEGADFLGVFNQVLAVFMLSGAVSSLGLNNATIKKISEESNPTIQKKVLSANFITSLIISFFVAITLAILSLFFGKIFSSSEVAKGIAEVSIAVPLYCGSKIMMSRLNAIRDQKNFSISRIIRWLGYILLIIGVAVLEFENIYYYRVIILIEIFLFSYLLYLQRQFLSFNLEKDVVLENISFGLKSYISELVSTSKDRLDIIIAGYFLTKADMGMFTFIYSICAGFLIIPGVIADNVNPIISNLWFKNQIVDLKLKLKRVFFNNIFITLSLLVVFMIGYYFILPLFTDLEIIENQNVFLIILCGNLIFGFVCWMGGILIMTNHLIMNIWRTVFIFLFGVGTMLILSNLYGIIGASVAIMSTAIFSTILLMVYVRFIFKSADIKPLNNTEQ